MSFVELSLSEYQAFLETLDYYSAFQTPQMAELLQKRGFQTKYVGLKEDTVKVAGILYSMPMTGGLHMEMNAGPAVADNSYLQTFYKGLQEYAKSNGALQLLVKPNETYQTFDTNGEPTSEEHPEFINNLTSLGYQHDGLTTGYPGGEPDWHYVKDLKGLTSQTLFKTFNKNSQRNIKKVEKLGVSIRNITKDEIPLFKALIEETGERQGFTDKDLSYYENVWDTFQDNADFLVAELDFKKALHTLQKNREALNETDKNYQTTVRGIDKNIELMQSYLSNGKESDFLACVLLLHSETETTYLFGGSRSLYHKISTPFLLQYAAMQKAIEKGIDFYNFLGIQGNFDGSDGVLRFKQNFNGYIIRKMGTFRYYPKPIKYKAIQLFKKLLGR